MRRDQLEQEIRTARQIIQPPVVIVVGSRAILSTYNEAQLPNAAKSDNFFGTCRPFGTLGSRRA
jgi:hypothetical protein